MVLQRPAFIACAVACAILTSCDKGSSVSKKPSPIAAIKFTRSGGLAGSRVAGAVTFSANHAYVDADGVRYRRELSAPELKQLRGDAEAADFGAARAALVQSAASPDAYQFAITIIAEDGTSRSLSFGENGADRLREASPAASRLAAWVAHEAADISNRL